MKQTENGVFLEADEYQDFLENNTNLAEEKTKEDVETNTPQISLYEINRQLIANMDPYGPEQLEEAKKALTEWVALTADRHYMFLCHEQRYYTLFDFTRTGALFSELVDKFFEVLEDFCQIFDISVDTNGAIAVWANWDDEDLPDCYYLFPYGKGVVRV